MPHVTLPKVGTDKAWRDAARACLAARLAPERLSWSRGQAQDLLFAEDEAPAPAKPGPIRVPESFVNLAAQVVWHRDPERFARLYAFLWRLRLNPGLMQDSADKDLTALRAMERAVSRDLHRLRGSVRFREIGERGASRRRFAAWIAPAHRTLEPAAPYFARRFAEMDWLIATPDLVARYEDGAVTFEEGTAPPDLPEDAPEELWRDWFRPLLDPARAEAERLAEMPPAYWKNAQAPASSDLLAGVVARPPGLAEAAPFFAKALAERPPMPNPTAPTASGLLRALEEEEDACTRCPLYANATQAVPGEGPIGAAMMLVGEAPGDQDDLAGRPFVGPGGQILHQLLRETGIDPAKVFLTNAVKHFKFTVKGIRRQHQAPNGGEIAACKWWLLQEISIVKPKLIVALGASAAESLTGSREGILKRRGTIEEGPEGLPVLISVHPSLVLRIPDPVAKEMETERFRQDMLVAKEHLERLTAG